MQRLNALRVDTRALAAPTVERGHLLDSPISHDERLEAMRKRALLAALSNDRTDCLQQLLAHMGSKAFARTLSTLNERQQAQALCMFSPETRAAVYRDFSQVQRCMWHKVCRNKQTPSHPLMTGLMNLLRALPRASRAASIHPSKATR